MVQRFDGSTLAAAENPINLTTTKPKAAERRGRMQRGVIQRGSKLLIVSFAVLVRCIWLQLDGLDSQLATAWLIQWRESRWLMTTDKLASLPQSDQYKSSVILKH